MRYGHPQQTQIVGCVAIGVGLVAASLTGEALAPARRRRYFGQKTTWYLHGKTMLRFDLYSIQEYISTIYIITKKGAPSSLWLKPGASRAHFGEFDTREGAVEHRHENKPQ